MDAIRLKIHDSTVPPLAQKIWGLDYVRTFAALGVVTLHACVPYAQRPIPGLLWVTTDQSTSPHQGHLIDLMLWSIEIMIMPLFLMMSGFLLWRSIKRHLEDSTDRKSVSIQNSVIRSRAKRLLLPLAFGVFVVLPIDLYLWTIGLFTDGAVPAIKLKSFAFSGTIKEQIWGPAHLWYLPYLFSYIVIAIVSSRLINCVAIVRSCYSRIQQLAAPVALVTLATVTLGCSIEVVWGFQNSFVPVPSKWIYSGLFFAAGIWLYQIDPNLNRTTDHSVRLLSIGVVFLATALALGFWHLDSPTTSRTPNGMAQCVLAALTVGCASLLSTGLLGLGNQIGRRRSPLFAYLSTASLWVYVIHLPILCLIQFDLKQLWPEGSSLVKLSVSLSLTILLSVATFEFFVRRTAFGCFFRFSSESNRQQALEPDDCGLPADSEVVITASQIAA